VALQKIFVNALTASIKANSYSNFSACFPTPARYCPSALEGVWQQLNARLEQECLRDFDQILEEKHVVEGLNQWEIMMEDARRRKNRAIDGKQPERPYG
jgi:kinetochore protein NNF1